jgi:hypothetical protein
MAPVYARSVYAKFMPTPKKKLPPISHEQLAKKAVLAHELAQEAKVAADKAKTIKDEVLAAMRESGTKAIEQRVGDELVRISLAEPESTVYNEDKILAAIKRKDPELLSLVTETVVTLDHGKLLTAVQKGQIPLRVVERNTEVVPRTPYVTITIKAN